MIAMEELIKKYPDEVLLPYRSEYDDEEESKEISLFFGTSIRKGCYYDLFYVDKFNDENKTFYNDHEELPAFIDAFNDLGDTFVNFDTNLLKKNVL